MRPLIFESDCVRRDMEDIASRPVEFAALDNTTVLVTGANGMLASYLVFFLAYLVETRGLHIRILAAVRSREKAEACFGALTERPYFRVLVLDLLEKIDLDEPVDYLFHAASLASPQHYAVRPVAVAEPNAIGTYRLLDFAARTRCKGFLYFSTGSVYGAVSGAPEVYEDTPGSVDPLDLHSCYNESKRMGENWCKCFAHERGVPAKVVRIWHTYGPQMDVENDPRVFASFLKCLLSGSDIVMHSTGQETRTFCYITDAVAGFLQILLKGEPGQAYNLCNTDQCLSIRALAELVAGLDPAHPVKVVCRPRDKTDSYLENRTYGQKIPQNRRLRELGWECRVSCEEGFARVYQRKLEERRLAALRAPTTL